MNRLIKISWRNFVRNISRFRILLTATIIAVTLMVIVLGYITGITDLIRLKASRYFSGDVTIQAYEERKTSLIPDYEQTRSIVEGLDLPISGMTVRSVYYSYRANLFFNGYYAKQRRLIGIDWELEKNIFEYLDFVDGAFPESDFGSSILISTASAERLQARVGDELTISLESDNGMRNTETLIVKGIFREESFLGYASYLDRRTLNRIMIHPENQVNEIGVYLNDQRDQDYVTRTINAELDKHFNVFPPFSSRAERSMAIASTWEGSKYAVLPLNFQIAEIQDLIDAMIFVSYTVFIIFMLIVIIGVSNTYSILIYERIKEIGTLRALGLTKEKTLFVIALEAIFMGLIATILGVVFGYVILLLIDVFVSFPAASVFSLFLAGNSLPWKIHFHFIFITTLITVGSSFIGALRPARTASNFSPVDAMRQV